jgi:hypothetical protein
VNWKIEEPMDPDRWRRIEQIYNLAIEIEPAQREEFLNQSCAEDESLRNEVERLLKGQLKAEKFIESPAVEVAARALFGTSTLDSTEGNAVASHAPAISKQPAVDFVAEGLDRKHSKRAPWWIYAIAAAFLICAAVRFYTVFSIIDPGFGAQAVMDKAGSLTGVLITAIRPHSPAARAGLEPGDVVLPANTEGFFEKPGQPRSGTGYVETGRPYRFEIKRGEEIKNIHITLERGFPMREWIANPNLSGALLTLLTALVDLVLAIVIVFLRPYDSAARWGALFLASIGIAAIYNIGMGAGYYGTLLRLPGIIGWLSMFTSNICKGSLSFNGLMFAVVFPRRLRLRRWI